MSRKGLQIVGADLKHIRRVKIRISSSRSVPVPRARLDLTREKSEMPLNDAVKVAKISRLLVEYGCKKHGNKVDKFFFSSLFFINALMVSGVNIKHMCL